MYNFQKDYIEHIIKPLEELRNEARAKYLSTLFFGKKKYKVIMDNLDELLIEKYNKFYEMSVEELEFDKHILESIKSSD